MSLYCLFFYFFGCFAAPRLRRATTSPPSPPPPQQPLPTPQPLPHLLTPIHSPLNRSIHSSKYSGLRRAVAGQRWIERWRQLTHAQCVPHAFSMGTHILTSFSVTFDPIDRRFSSALLLDYVNLYSKFQINPFSQTPGTVARLIPFFRVLATGCKKATLSAPP